MCTAVVLHAPLGPSIPHTAPSAARRSSPVSAAVRPKLLHRPSAITMASLPAHPSTRPPRVHRTLAYKVLTGTMHVKMQEDAVLFRHRWGGNRGQPLTPPNPPSSGRGRCASHAGSTRR